MISVTINRDYTSRLYTVSTKERNDGSALYTVFKNIQRLFILYKKYHASP